VPLTRLLARFGVRHGEHVSVARDFSVYSGVNIVSLVLLLGTGLILRRYIGPLFAGIWTGLEILPIYAQYAHLGTLSAAERELPFLLGARRTADFDRLKHTLFWLSHGLGLLLALALLIGAFALQPRVSRPFFIGMLVYSPILWTQTVATYYLLLYRARKRFVALSGRQGAANLIKAGLTMGCGYWWGLYGVFAALLVASAVQLLLFHTGLDERFERVFDRALVGPLFFDGVPILAGAVAMDTLRTADRIVIAFALGAEALGVYSVTQIICQGVFYLPNTLSLVMYPRFQTRYGETQDAASLRTFVELPLHVLADALLAAVAVLFIALPPAIAAFLPQYVETIAPLRVMLVGTYFLCLVSPPGQLLLTIHKQVPLLLIVVPAMACGLAGGYLGASRGLVGVAAGVSASFLLEFVGVTAYAFSHLTDGLSTARRLASIVGRAAVFLLLVVGVERFVPAGPPMIAVVGGWRLVVVSMLSLPLLMRAAQRIRDLQGPDRVDNVRAGH
jgi:O-antigen/teichoic acid export membrane protein